MPIPPAALQVKPSILCIAVIAGVGLINTGCATRTTALPPVVAPAPPQVATPAPPPAPPPAVVEPPPAAPQPATVMTQALMEQATRLELGGTPLEAAAAIEQAIRIEPRRGELWLQLAVLRIRGGMAANAEQTARKALLFIPRGSGDERAAWLLIANARELQGDVDGARAIRDQWNGRG